MEYYNSLKEIGFRAVTAMMIISMLTCWSWPSIAQESRQEYSCGTAPIRISLPASWEAVTITHPSVRCAFRVIADGFPTLNIVEDPPHASPITTTNAAAEIERSYHLVGLTDAKASPAEMSVIDHHQALTSIVRYTNANKRMIGVVTIISLPGRDFTVTVTSPLDASAFSKSDLTALTSSLHITAEAGMPTETSKAIQPESANWIAESLGSVLCAVGLLLLALVYLKRRRRS